MVLEDPAFGGGPVRLDFQEDERGTDLGASLSLSLSLSLCLLPPSSLYMNIDI